MPTQSSSSPVPCLLQTWHLSESALFHWLFKRCGDKDLAFDVLQETFLRALQKQKSFCDIQNQSAWLFRVASHLLIDEWRYNNQFKPSTEFIEHIDEPNDIPAPIDSLAQCLPKALKRLTSQEREIIDACDLKGMSQQVYAIQNGLTLSATKSRIQRARKKLKETLKSQCQIRFDDNQQVCCFFPEQP